jgi:hypothetical protein
MIDYFEGVVDKVFGPPKELFKECMLDYLIEITKDKKYVIERRRFISIFISVPRFTLKENELILSSTLSEFVHQIKSLLKLDLDVSDFRKIMKSMEKKRFGFELRNFAFDKPKFFPIFYFPNEEEIKKEELKKENEKQRRITDFFQKGKNNRN